MNSLPSRVASPSVASTIAPAPIITRAGRVMNAASTGSYARRAQRISRFSFSSTRSPMNSATAAGMNVTVSTIAAASAITTVIAIGWNILPSTPVSAKIGRYTTMMISCPKISARRASCDAPNTSAKRSSRVSGRPAAACACASRRTQFSTITTAPSTMIPKSSAPRLIRFALTFALTIPVKVISIDSGITSAVISAARMLPRNRNSTAITSTAPSSRFFFTVATAFSTSTVRSYTGIAFTPAGSVRFTSSIFAATAFDTVRLFSPINMNTVPSTTSSPFDVAAPVRSSRPTSTTPTSFIRTGTPPTLVSTMFAMSSTVRAWPGTRTRYCSPRFSM